VKHTQLVLLLATIAQNNGYRLDLVSVSTPDLSNDDMRKSWTGFNPDFKCGCENCRDAVTRIKAHVAGCDAIGDPPDKPHSKKLIN
jgi:hypothetical protein